MIRDQVTVGVLEHAVHAARFTARLEEYRNEPGRILFLYTPAKAGGAFEEAVRINRPISSMSQQEAAERRQRHGSETVGPPPF